MLFLVSKLSICARRSLQFSNNERPLYDSLRIRVYLLTNLLSSCYCLIALYLPKCMFCHFAVLHVPGDDKAQEIRSTMPSTHHHFSSRAFFRYSHQCGFEWVQDSASNSPATSPYRARKDLNESPPDLAIGEVVSIGALIKKNIGQRSIISNPFRVNIFSMVISCLLTW